MLYTINHIHNFII